jgi:hypothetical protein
VLRENEVPVAESEVDRRIVGSKIAALAKAISGKDGRKAFPLWRLKGEM